ncbi:MAG: S16 family serine protease [Terrimesophilobacter sp.]
MRTSRSNIHSLATSGTKAVAIVLASALLLSACAIFPEPSPSPSLQARKTEVTVPVLYAAGPTGGQSLQTISVVPSADGHFTLDVSENEVSGVGDMIRAASWNAVMVATMLTGASLANKYRFQLSGRVDGPSAGGLTTAAVLSLFLGDDILKGVSMTGTINPTGTIGPVGGIPQKLQGVIDAGTFTRILIPAGQRNTTNYEGREIDVVAMGKAAGVEVIEVADIYEAYRHLTGKEIPSPTSSSDPKMNDVGYAKFKSAADSELAGFQSAAAQFQSLSNEVQAVAQGTYDEAESYANRARGLQAQGLQGGAFIQALTANFLMRATTAAYTTAQLSLHQGVGALAAKLSAVGAVDSKFMAFLDELGNFKPKTLTDVENLVTAYGNIFDAYSLLRYAENNLDEVLNRVDGGEYSSFEALLDAALTPLLLFEFASAQIDATKSIFNVGRDNGGAAIAKDVDLESIGSFFRRGADANWAAFEAGFIQPYAIDEGVSNDVLRNALMNADIAVALSYTAKETLPSLQSYIGAGKPNSAYAAMGYGFVNYARNALHVEKYYSNAILDENFEVVGVRSEVALSRALELGRSQSAKAVAVLGTRGTIPLLTVGDFEQAGVNREGGFGDKFSAIQSFSGQFIVGRILAFVGGFPAEGFQR